jgi:tRNA pseudouridine65 synthase
LIEILHQDTHLVAVNKPSGLLTHRSPIDRHESRFAVQLVRDQIGQRVYPVHRLDKPTSGVLLFALSRQVASTLGRSIASGGFEKNYLAVVRGHAPLEGSIDHAIRQKPDPLAGIAPNMAPEPAITRYQRLETVEWPDPVDRYPVARYSLVSLRPETGRRHQLRRHLKHIAHPVIGDTTYGKSSHNHYFRERFGSSRLLLHAVELAFEHPETGQVLTIRASLDEVFSRVLEEAGWAMPLL